MQPLQIRVLPTLLGMAALLSLAAAQTASAQTHVYTLNNTLADANGGPPLMADGGTISSSGYTFGKDQGLTLSNALADPGTYSISMTFSLTGAGVDRYDKLLDFKGLGSDNGLYLYYGRLDYYPVTGDPGTFVAAPNQPLTVTLSRDAATQIVTGAINGVQQFSFTDTTNDAVFSQPGGAIHFFEDDTATGGNEASGGKVTNITIVGAPVPEASTTVSLGLLLALGMGGVVATRKKRKV